MLSHYNLPIVSFRLCRCCALFKFSGLPLPYLLGPRLAYEMNSSSSFPRISELVSDSLANEGWERSGMYNAASLYSIPYPAYEIRCGIFRRSKLRYIAILILSRSSIWDYAHGIFFFSPLPQLHLKMYPIHSCY